jgi:hypothetical protein
METIGNQEYYEFDTVSCVSMAGTEFSGFLYTVGNSCYMTVIKNGTKSEFRYETVNPLRMVLIEKEYKIENYKYESVTFREEYNF